MRKCSKLERSTQQLEIKLQQAEEEVKF